MDGRRLDSYESPGASTKLRIWADTLMLAVLFIGLACASPLGAGFSSHADTSRGIASIVPKWGLYVATALCGMAALTLMIRTIHDSTAIVLRPLGRITHVSPSTAHIAISALLLWLSSSLLPPGEADKPTWLMVVPAVYFFGSLACATWSTFQGTPVAVRRLDRTLEPTPTGARLNLTTQETVR
jgi:hypothetical protein